MSNLVHNEQVKMSANMWNSLGVISLATGAIVPAISSFFTTNGPGAESASATLLLGGGFGLTFIHMARSTLTHLRE